MNEFVIKNGFHSKGDSEITGSLNVTGGITGSFSGSLNGLALSASYSTTASSADNFLVRNDLTLSGSLYSDALSVATERVLTITGSQVTASLELEEFEVVELSTALSTYTGSIACATLNVSQSSVFSGSATFEELIAIGTLYITPSGSTTDTGSWKLELSGSDLRLEKYNGTSWDWSTTFTI